MEWCLDKKHFLTNFQAFLPPGGVPVAREEDILGNLNKTTDNFYSQFLKQSAQIT
jgi:hypothetical protein